MKKESWVRAGIIKELTIFTDDNKLRTARTNGYLLFKRENGSFLYDLNSVHERFFTKKIQPA
ncbi:MAG: hypothetical protein JST87_05500 [Bacteroidetes bacterium]|nr:hypothetical protein [Bacteroidota bacterium]